MFYKYVPKTPVYRFDLYGRYQILWTDEDNFLVVLLRVGIQALQYTDWTYMGGTGPGGPRRIIFDTAI